MKDGHRLLIGALAAGIERLPVERDDQETEAAGDTRLARVRGFCQISGIDR